MKRISDKQLSLFADPQPPAARSVSGPIWEYHSLPYVDFIADETVAAFCYDLHELERLPDYGVPVLGKLMEGLAALTRSREKGLRNQAFTIYGGEVFVNGVFVIAPAAKSAKVVDFLAAYLRSAPGDPFFEASSSVDLLPLYRYDHGSVIEYSDGGLEGTSYVDAADNFGTGLTIYRRIWLPAEQIRRSRSVYGKLVRPHS